MLTVKKLITSYLTISPIVYSLNCKFDTVHDGRLDVCHIENTYAFWRQEFFHRWTVSLELCLSHYVTETSHLYS